jgi:hypothetical protein
MLRCAELEEIGCPDPAKAAVVEKKDFTFAFVLARVSISAAQKPKLPSPERAVTGEPGAAKAAPMAGGKTEPESTDGEVAHEATSRCPRRRYVAG